MSSFHLHTNKTFSHVWYLRMSFPRGTLFFTIDMLMSCPIREVRWSNMIDIIQRHYDHSQIKVSHSGKKPVWNSILRYLKKELSHNSESAFLLFFLLSVFLTRNMESSTDSLWVFLMPKSVLSFLYRFPFFLINWDVVDWEGRGLDR